MSIYHTTSPIHSWPEQERPRERLLKQGPHSLSDAELLAIFLRSGSQQHSAVSLARQLIQHFGGLNPIFDCSLEQLTAFHGIGSTKYAQIMAVKELGRRYMEQDYLLAKKPLNQSKHVIDFLRYQLQGEKQEVFAVLCLDAELCQLDFSVLFYGSLNQCQFSSNQFTRHIIKHHASQIIICHTHPFGHAHPSDADYQLTTDIQKICSLLEIQLVDHCIIAPTGSFSFAEHQLI
ncbi:DNA repair protein RadC [Acinetobacter sp. B5B]|uniref:RadC family protein n=1 Tax=Acinetobacter baretiae TaxID=2605383 RepID=UPI0018C25E5D|nr:DNA repair protein RadC [Acinetobacter baretiae]MBF7683818.1 DNA repair protein RadC [Acinetobacter baretiae]MBF7686108.1 DNA repair protein RadC [Acinetobacter baretiae]